MAFATKARLCEPSQGGSLRGLNGLGGFTSSIDPGWARSSTALLDSKTFVQRPGVSLSEAKRHAIDLVRELKILERNIHVFTQRILDDAATAANVLEEGLERYPIC